MSVTIAELKDRTGLELPDGPAKALYSALQRVERQGSHEDIDEVLDLANRLIDEQGDYAVFGVEPIRDEGAWDSYYTDVVALYVNTGDTYNPTLLYDVEQNEFFVTSWGDWYEQYEREKAETTGSYWVVKYTITDADDFTASYEAIVQAVSPEDVREIFDDAVSDNLGEIWQRTLEEEAFEGVGQPEKSGDAWYVVGIPEEEGWEPPTVLLRGPGDMTPYRSLAEASDASGSDVVLTD